MEKCVKCHYGKALSYKCKTEITVFCDYLCMTGKRRGCDGENCDKFKPREERASFFTRGGIGK